MAKMIIDDKEVKAQGGLTLLDVFRKIGIEIPTLCHHEAVSPYGACRLCLVEVTMGRRNMLAASCLYPVTDGVTVETASERVLRARKMVLELLLARSPNVPYIQELAKEHGIEDTRFRKRDDRCILCGLCVRGCREIAGVGVLDFSNRGVYMEVATPFKMPSDACVGCTTCVYLCPTDAIRLGDIRELNFAKPRVSEMETSHHVEEGVEVLAAPSIDIVVNPEIRPVKCALRDEHELNPMFQEIEGD